MRADPKCSGVGIGIENVGGVTRQYQAILCSECGRIEKIHGTGGYYPEHTLMKMGHQKGWSMHKRGKHRCPDCVEKQKQKTEKAVTDIRIVKPSPSECPPREMQPQDRRRIFKAIDEVYDTANGRYLRGYGDASIAKDLACPRKWVEIVRDEAFGPAGEDPELAMIRTEIGRVEADVKRAANDCVEIMATAETKLKALSERLSALEKVARR
jgi:hypothetical protein